MTINHPRRIADLIDGTESTFALGEQSWKDIAARPYWARGTSGGSSTNLSYCCRNLRYGIRSFASDWTTRSNSNSISFGSHHPGGCHFLMVGGSVQFLGETTELKILQALATRGLGEVASLP